MASGFLDGLRRGRDAAIAARGRRRPAVESDTDPSQTDDGSLEQAFRALESEHDESKRLIGELVETVELLQGRVKELIAGAEAMASVLRLRGVKNFLLLSFHPDRHPDASEQERKVFEEAMQTINAAYAVIAKELQSEAD
jgi:hypothetical protein